MRRRREDDLERELRAHLDLEAEEQGDRDAARRALGNLTLIKEVTREMWEWTSVERFNQDIRYALRTMRKAPGFTITAVFSLALGIGANTAIFSLIDALMLRWLPVRDPQHLVQLKLVERRDHPGDSFSYPVVRALADRTDVFSGLCGFSGSGLNVGAPEVVERVDGAWVTGGFYETLGVQAVAGRLLTRDDDEPGAALAAVISHGYWQHKFGGDPQIAGKSILIEGIPVTIAGVSPAGFTGANVGQVADITMAFQAVTRLVPDGASRLTANSQWIRAIARPQPGLSMAQVKARLDVIWPQIAPVAVTPRTPPERRQVLLASTLDVAPGGTGWSMLRGRFRQPLLVLMAIVGLVLLISCANVANLLLARATARRREIAVRLAIGGGRVRVIRQLLTESALLSLLGAALGIIIAYLSSRGLVQLLAGSTGGGAALMLDLRPDALVLGFTSAVAIGTTLLFGLTPAFRATAAGPGPALKDDARTSAGSRGGLAPALVVTQVALSLLLLIGAGLFVRTFENLRNLNPGFRHEGVLLVDVGARGPGRTDIRTFALYQELLERVERIPGVTSASLSSVTPLSGGIWSDSVSVNGQPPPPKSAHFNSVSPRYFETMRIPMVAGRDFNARDNSNAPRVTIVNEAFVRYYIGAGNPLGQSISVPRAPDRQNMEIVGVVKDSVSFTLREPPPPAVYYPFLQNGMNSAYATFEVYAGGSLAKVASAVNQEMRAAMPGAPPRVHTLTSQVEGTLVQERLMATLAAGFAFLALALAVVGLYGLLAYTVARRTSEIGIRMALGAERRQVMWMVLRGALVLVAVGVAIGLPAAWAASRWVSSMLFGVTATDPPTLLGTTVLLAVAAAVAGFLPARRASRVDPMVALRYE